MRFRDPERCKTLAPKAHTFSAEDCAVPRSREGLVKKTNKPLDLLAGKEKILRRIRAAKEGFLSLGHPEMRSGRWAAALVLNLPATGFTPWVYGLLPEQWYGYFSCPGFDCSQQGQSSGPGSLFPFPTMATLLQRFDEQLSSVANSGRNPHFLLLFSRTLELSSVSAETGQY